MSIQHEAREQEALFRWAAFAVGKYPELKLLYHIPNGGSRNKAEAAHLKRQGVKAGVPDLHLPVARSGYHGLYIELKAGKNKTSKNQDRWLSDLAKEGYCAMVCYGFGEAKNAILSYLGGKADEQMEI